MAEEKGKKSSSSSSEGGSSGNSGFLKKAGCAFLFLLLLLISFLLGTLYGREVFPWLFEKAHKGVDTVSGQAHMGIEKADTTIKEKSR
jgi:preprotein translocase subunit SecG